MAGRTSLILVAHKDEELLKSAIAMVRAQTLQPFELIVCYSDMYPVLPDDVIWTKHANRDDYGYEKRAAGLGLARGEFIMWWNFDDLYVPTTLFRMERLMDDADVVHCLFGLDKPGSSPTTNGNQFRSGYCDAGSFMIRTTLARQVGYFHRHSCADGDFIDAVARLQPRIKLVEEALMTKR